jgi:hypothetical protein
VTPLGTGSSWQIDDLYVDPCSGRLGQRGAKSFESRREGVTFS